MTLDESRALGLFLNQHPGRTVAVAAGGWNSLTPGERQEAEDLFQAFWERSIDHEPIR